MENVALGSSPIILSMQSSGKATWTSSLANRIATFQVSTNLQPTDWVPYFYDFSTASTQVTVLPMPRSPQGFCRLAIQTNVPDASLVMHFPLDNAFSNGIVLDVSGHNNHGVRFSSTNWPSAVNGIVGPQSAHYRPPTQVIQGTEPHSYGDYIAVTNWNGIEFLTNGTISVWAWFDVNSYAATALLNAGYSVGAAIDSASATYSWHFGRDYTEGVCFVVFMPASDVKKVYFPDDTIYNGGNSTYATTNWNLYSVTWNAAANQIIGYYNGTPYSTNTMDAPYLRIYSPFHWLAIGCWHHEGTPQMDYGLPGGDMYPNNGWMGGSIDDVRIYNRALNAAEITVLYNARAQ